LPRIFFITLVLCLTLSGQSAHANSDTIMCHDNSNDAEGLRAKLVLPDADRNKRQKTLRSWIAGASRSQISEIWGEPTQEGKIIYWAIPLELSRPVSDTYTEGGRTCFSQANGHRIMIVEEGITSSPKQISRDIKLIVATGRSYSPSEK